MIPPAFVQDLLARADIVEVVGRHVELKKAGVNHKGLCPFHGEKSPSFIVSPTRQTYHCFGCGVHGNAVGFLMEHGGMGFVEAVHSLAEQVGMPIPEDDRSAQEREHERAQKKRQSTLTDVLARTAEHYRKHLKGSPRAVDYLKGRGLTGEIAARFGLGYAPEGWRGLASVFPQYDDLLLVESGLVIVQGEDEAEQKRYDRFRDRIMFPILNVQGETIGFGGRVLDHGEPKYLNSPETPVFHKGRELYGLFEARRTIRERNYVLVVEGYMDVVALAQLGIANAVATLGTACTAEHMTKLFRFTESVVFSFDGDAAGRRAAARALEASLPHATDTHSIRFLFLPPEHDPDSYVRAFGAEGFEHAVAQAVPLSRRLVEQASENCELNDAEGRARMLVNAKPLWSALPEGALKQQVLADLATAARSELGDLKRLWSAPGANSSRRVANPSSQHIAKNPASRGRRIDRGTANLLDRALWLLTQRSDLWDDLDTAMQDHLVNCATPYGPAFSALDRSAHDQGPLAPAALLAELRARLQEPACQPLISRIEALLDPAADADLAKEMAIVVDRLRLRVVEDELSLLFESGVPAGEAQSRGRELMAEQARLKAHLAASATAGR